jgi:O-antigen ligase
MGLDFGGSNGRAAFSTQCTLFLLAVFGSIKSMKVRALAIPLIFAGLYAVVFSYSRGAYAAFAMGILYLAIFRVRLFLVAFLLIPFLGTILPTSVIQRVTMTYDAGELDNSSANRVEIWKEALNTSMKDPILGVGFDCYHLYRAGEELLDTHNMYVKAVVETGIVGTLILVCFFFGSFYAGHQLSRIATDPFYRALGAGFAAYMVAVIITNIFGDRWTYVDLSGFTWILLGLVIQATRWTREPANPTTLAPVQLQVPALAGPPRAFQNRQVGVRFSARSPQS